MRSSSCPPCLSLFFWAGLQDPMFWHPGSPLVGSGSRESRQTGTRLCRGLGGGGGQVLEGRQPAGCESEPNTAPASPCAIAWDSFALVPAQRSLQKHTPHTCHLGRAWEQLSGASGSCLPLVIISVPSHSNVKRIKLSK